MYALCGVNVHSDCRGVRSMQCRWVRLLSIGAGPVDSSLVVDKSHTCGCLFNDCVVPLCDLMLCVMISQVHRPRLSRL